MGLAACLAALAGHPEGLAKATQLFSLGLDHPLKIVNRSQYLTKAEMCALPPAALRPTIGLTTIGLTESCDTAFAYRGERTAWLRSMHFVSSENASAGGRRTQRPSPRRVLPGSRSGCGVIST